ncbi:glutathione synthetase, chloroplastic isoform X1 [Elaeis guineensis]|uniref:Glutathione synthetase n=1 Tax=Elaeis guineensis var. tenera TaxID=51953 RepID=A0A6I9R7T5_ELAGV|nr:glutathione synthetase, chloroplastic isoform X1 [Elaeis guineensis]
MGAGCSTLCLPASPSLIAFAPKTIAVSDSSTPTSNYKPKFSSRFTPTTIFFSRPHLRTPHRSMDFSSSSSPVPSSSLLPVQCGRSDELEESRDKATEGHGSGAREVPPGLLEKLVYDALVWCSLHGLVVGDKSVQRSGTDPGIGLVHAPFALLPRPLTDGYWRQACELAPIFNELVDRVSLDGKFLQDSLSRTKKVDAFTGRLLDIHSKMLEMNKREDIRLGLHRSDYMLDAETNLLFQIELNTISSSFPGLSCLVSELHKNLINHYGKDLGLDSRRVPGNTAVSRYAEALAKAWNEYNNCSALVMVVVQTEERNMYDQHWLCVMLKEMHGVASIRKTLAEIDAEGQVLPDGTLVIGGQTVAVVYFRAGYSPNDYPSESEWRARLLMEQSNAIKCPSISYHLVGTKKIQQELAKPNVLERFLENENDIAKLRKCFAGLWSLDNIDVVKSAIERPEFFVLKPQREGGGNNIYGDKVRETLIRLQQEGSEELAAYILMQRIFPTASLSYLVREGICHQDHAISELGIYGAYLRNKDKVIMNDQCGYLMRTKVSTSNEGGVAAGFAVLDSIYLT